ncbi:hypothetical protein ACIF83_02020 [Streptomyces sp. NPDC085866]|uniref:hypothetical protein n=1 Tax=Streptomyces sp. NPDC085866 TaxID=3365736 RepID=UPI0037D62C3A
MTAEHEGAGEYAGMDALMAAITGEPLSEEAREDAAYLSEHTSAEADVAVLKEQLTWLAEALTGEERTAAPAVGENGSTVGPARSAQPGKRPRSATRPTSPARPPRPGRPSGPRRALRIALGTLVGAAAFGMVFGLGRLVVNSGANDSMGGSSADAKSEGHAPMYSGDGGRPSDPALSLACYRLVVEGTVAKVEPKPENPWTLVVLKVSRSYKPAHQPAEVSFLLDGGAKPAPRKGQHVLIGVGQGQDNASLWAVGDSRVAVDRAWITEVLPEARHTTCPSEEAPTDKP